MELTPAELRALADRIESHECTGIAAGWCPVHGSCTCPKNEEDDRRPAEESSPTCELHGQASNHADAIAQGCGQPL